MDIANQEKWDRASRSFDFMASNGAEKRWRPAKLEFFKRMKPDNEILFVGLGTGLDISCFPAGMKIRAIDISPKMLEKSEPRIAAYDGDITAEVMDVHDMPFADNSFAQVFTSCTFCSVPDPVAGLTAIHRVLKHGGELHMFEHTGSKVFPFSFMMDLMSLAASRAGPELNRDTVTNVSDAGFRITAVNHIFLDTVKTIHAIRE
jgi:ubiquinone/menaquinone biosynthesis C-methylase UbiE